MKYLGVICCARATGDRPAEVIHRLGWPQRSTSLRRYRLSSFFSPPLPAASSAPLRWGSTADRAVSSAATPAATAASLATRFSFDVLRRLDFFDFVGSFVFVCLRVFDLAATRFELVFDLTRRFDEVLDLARFFAFFMISPVQFDLVQIGLQSYCWQAVGMDFPLSAAPPAPRNNATRRDERDVSAGRRFRSVVRARPRRLSGREVLKSLYNRGDRDPPPINCVTWRS